MQSQSEEQAYKLVQNVISGQETIRWIGVPDPIHAIRTSWIASAFGLVFAAVSGYMFSQMSSTPKIGSGPFTLRPGIDFQMFSSMVMVLFVVVAVVFIFSPLWGYLTAKGKVYAITNQRALIIERFPSEKQTSYYPKDIKFVRVHGQGIGDVVFDSQVKTISRYENVPGSTRQRMVRRNVRVNIGFFSLPNPTEASSLLLELKKSQEQQVQKFSN